MMGDGEWLMMAIHHQPFTIRHQPSTINHLFRPCLP
jgi:hypothetical protein